MSVITHWWPQFKRSVRKKCTCYLVKHELVIRRSFERVFHQKSNTTIFCRDFHEKLNDVLRVRTSSLSLSLARFVEELRAVVICVKAMRMEFNELESLKMFFNSLPCLRLASILRDVCGRNVALSRSWFVWHAGVTRNLRLQRIQRSDYSPLSHQKCFYDLFRFVRFIYFSKSIQGTEAIHTTDYWETPTHDNMCTRKGFFY